MLICHCRKRNKNYFPATLTGAAGRRSFVNGLHVLWLVVHSFSRNICFTGFGASVSWKHRLIEACVLWALALPSYRAMCFTDLGAFVFWKQMIFGVDAGVISFWRALRATNLGLNYVFLFFTVLRSPKQACLVGFEH